MHIGIIVYSHTGHTLSVARKLRAALSAAGHAVDLKQLRTVGSLPLNAETAELEAVPQIAGYDALVLGSPVRGGRMSAPMAAYLERVPSLEGKQVACLVTGFFPAAWGRDQTIAQMKSACEVKGATVCGSASVGWFSLRRRRQISRAVDRLSQLF